MPQLKLFLFGTPRLQGDNQPLNLNRRKALALLAYLAVSGQAHSREALVTLLWPEQDLSTGLTNLRSELYRLRKLLGNENFEVARSQINLSGSSEIWLDVLEFRDRIAIARQHHKPDEMLCEACASNLAEAVHIYTEDFMAGFSLPDSLDFDEWQFFQAESLRHDLTWALQQLIVRHSQQQEFDAAINYARRWLALDELHELAHRELIRLYALAGQQSAALRQFEICQRLLNEELGITPDAITQDLAEAIKLRRFPSKSDQDMEARAPSFSRDLVGAYRPAFLDEDAFGPTISPVFVARENELAALTSALETATNDEGQLLFVIGGAGRGKTMLLKEFARRSLADNPELIVASGNCKAQIGIGDPYLPFREILDMLTGNVEALWAGGLISTTHARRLWRLIPVAVAHLVNYGVDLIDSFVPSHALFERAAVAVDTEDADWFSRLSVLVNRTQQRQIQQKHIFAQVTAVLKAIAAHQPLLLIFEDLHWADAASVSLLFHLSQVVSDKRILIVGTYRPTEISISWNNEQHPLARITGELKRRHGDIWLDLGELAAIEGRRFVDAYLDTQANSLNESFREALYSHTGGHALFTVELLRAMQKRGDLIQNDQGIWIASEAIDWRDLPAKIEGVIEHHMHRLDNDAKTTLVIASIEGETFTAEVVSRVQGLDERKLVRRLSRELDKQHRLVTAQSLERLGTQRLSIYQFRHNLFQQYLYNSLDETERTYFHEAVGNALEAIYENHTEKIAVALAYHFRQAGLIIKATEYLLQAGKQATLLSAIEEAVEHFHNGLALLQRLPDSTERNEQELHLQLALAMSLTASKGYAAAEVHQAFERARILTGQIVESPQLGTVLFGLSRFYMAAGQHQPARELAEQLLLFAETRQDTQLLMSAHYAMGLALFYHGEFKQGLRHSDEVLELYHPSQHSVLALHFGQDPKTTHLGYAALDLWFLGYADQARRNIETAVSLAHKLSHWLSAAHALGIGALFHIYNRKGQAALDKAENLLLIAIEREFSFWVAIGELLKGMALVLLGQYESGLAHLDKGMPAYFGTGARLFKTTFLAGLAEAHAASGAIAEGLTYLAEALSFAESSHEYFYKAELYRLQGKFVLAHEADADEAEVMFEQAITIARHQQAKSLELRATVSLATLWQLQEKQAEARQILTETLDWFSDGLDTVDLLQAKALLKEIS